MPERLPAGATSESLAAELEGEHSEDDRDALAARYGFTAWRNLESQLTMHRPKANLSEWPFEQLACLNYSFYDAPENWE